MEFDNKHGALPPINSAHRRRKSNRWIYISVIAVLVVTNVGSYLYFKDNNETHVAGSDVVSFSNEIAQPKLEQQNHEISSYYNNALSKLDELSLDNFALQQQLKDKNSEIYRLKENIEDILKDKDATRLDLKRAEIMVKDLEGKVNFYTAQVEKYKKDNELISSELNTLKEQNKTLEKENVNLSKKLEDIQYFSVNNIKILPIELRRGRNETITSKARKVDIFRVTFDIIENRILDAGSYEFYLRIIDPEGELIFNTSSGSSQFKMRNSQEQMRFTKSRKIHFSDASPLQGVNIDWEQPNDYLKGEYTIELYNNGHLIGRAVRHLK